MAKKFRVYKSWRGFVEVIGMPKHFADYLDLYIELLKSTNKVIYLKFRVSKYLEDEYGEWVDGIDDLLQYLKKEGLIQDDCLDKVKQ